MNASAIARPYAKAVFELARAESAYKEWSTTLELLATIASNKETRHMITRPHVSNEQRIELFSDICGKALKEQDLNLLKLLTAEQRLLFLPEIKKQFDQLLAEQQKIIDVKVVSAFAIDAEQQQNLAATLTQRLQRNVILTYEIDRSLIGGAIIYANDKVIDGSV